MTITTMGWRYVSGAAAGFRQEYRRQCAGSRPTKGVSQFDWRAKRSWVDCIACPGNCPGHFPTADREHRPRGEGHVASRSALAHEGGIRLMSRRFARRFPRRAMPSAKGPMSYRE